ncbi:MAG: endo alpha-1,4 polygalactosaminidase [Actinomycetes bacterium]
MSPAHLIRHWFAGTFVVLALLPTPGAPTRPTPAPAAPLACPQCWHPTLDTSWDWVLSKVPKAPYRSVDMYDVDGFDAAAADVSAMHAAGIKVVCYLSAGTFEDWRPDSGRFPAAILGRPNGWPGERWLDIRDAQHQGSALLSIMRSRLDMCRRKGFDGVELDNVDGFTNKTSVPLTAADQIYYNTTLANGAHRRGLMVLQKNDNAQIPRLQPYFDGALNEQCNQYRECTTAQNGSYGYDQYVAAGKPVFQVEYALKRWRFCTADNAANFNGVRFDLDLDGSVFQPCR